MSAAALLGGRTFRSIRDHRNYRLYFAGQVVSVSGTWMQNVAQAWLVLQLTGSASAVGLLAAFQFGPFFLLGLAGGVVVDGLDRRRILVVTQTVPILLAGSLAALAATGRVTLWEVYLLAALNGLVQVLDVPARQAFTVEMVGRDELANAVALNSSLFNASRIIGPALGGVLIGWGGVGLCFGINALSYVAVLAALLLMHGDELHRVVRRQQPPLLRGIVEGVAYAGRTPRVRTVLLMMLAVGTIAINFNVVLPVLTQRTLHSGAQTLGLLSACFGAGAVIGALLSASFRGSSFPALVGGCAGLGATELAIGAQGGVLLSAGLLLCCGVAFTFYTSNSNSTLQLAVPDALRGRILSLYAYAFFGTAPIGGYLAGWMSDRGGTRLSLTVMGGTALVAAAVGAAWWVLRGAPAGGPRPVAAEPVARPAT